MEVFRKETPISNLIGATAITIAVLTYLGVIEVYDVYFNKELIFKEHQIYRLFTSLFFSGPFNLEFLISIIFLLQYSTTAEESFFANRPGDFLFFILFGMICIWTYSYFSSAVLLCQAFSSYMTYYCSKRAPDVVGIAFIFPVHMRSVYLNLLFLVLHLLLGNFPLLYLEIVGYLAAHAYFYFQDIFSLRYEINLLTAPKWLNKSLNRLLHNRNMD